MYRVIEDCYFLGEYYRQGDVVAQEEIPKSAGIPPQFQLIKDDDKEQGPISKPPQKTKKSRGK